MSCAVFSLLTATAVAAAPKEWDQFTCEFAQTVNGMATFGAGSVMNFDDKNSRQLLAQMTRASFAPSSFKGTASEWINITQYEDSDGTWLSRNGQAYQLSTTAYTNMFEWAEYSNTGRREEVDGSECKTWSFTGVPTGWQYKYYATVEGEYPVRMWTDQASTTQTDWNVTTFKPSVDASLFDFNKSSASKPSVCPPESSSPVTLEMYSLQAPNTTSLANTNPADLVGIATAVCANVSSLAGLSLTKFPVQVWPAWGQYQMCSAGMCVGANSQHVGRVASMFLNSNRAGQCSANNETGSWFSLPEAAECLGSLVPSATGCAWKEAAASKALPAACIESKVLPMCLQDGTMPWSNVVNTITALFTGQAMC